MNKQEFLLALRGALSDLPEADIKASLDYYAEIIDDQMEEGITETTFLIHGMTTEKQIQGFMHRLIGKTQKLARRVTLEGNYFKNAALVTVHAEHR